MPLSREIGNNVETLEARARTLEQQEIDRSRAIDQKSAGLMAACLVALGANVAFASKAGDLLPGTTRTVWAIALIAAMVLALVALGFATLAIRPQTIHTAIHMDELTTWGTTRMLDRDPIEVRGELMMASIDAVGEARHANRCKGDRLHTAFLFFAAAMIATLVMGVSVLSTETRAPRPMPNDAPKDTKVEQPSEPPSAQPGGSTTSDQDRPLFRTLKRDHAIRESDDSTGDGDD